MIIGRWGDMPQKLRLNQLLDLYAIIETKMKNRKNWEENVIINVHNEFIEVCQIEEYITYALMIGDNIKCRVVTNDSIIVMNAVVYNIKLVSNSIVLKILNVERRDNARKHKRYETTCSGTFRHLDDISEKYIVVNNVSRSGLCLITKDKLSKGDNIEVNIKRPGGDFISLECTAVWVTQTEQNYFCGLSITYMDDVNRALYESFIKRLQRKEQRKKQKLQQEAINSIRTEAEPKN